MKKYSCQYCRKKFDKHISMTNHRRHHYGGFTKKFKAHKIHQFITKDSIRRISESKIGRKNPQWKGDKVEYGALHEYIKSHKIKPSQCQNCNKICKLDLCNISGEYIRDTKDWEWLCRRCHMLKDGRLINFKNGRIGKHSYLKGRSYEKYFGVERAKSIKNKISKTLKGNQNARMS